MGYPTFATGEVLTAADMNAVGLWKIASTTGTNQTTLFIDGCFTSNFSHYLITYDLTTNITGQYTGLRLRAATTPKAVNYDRSALFTTTGGVTGIDGFGVAQTEFYLAGQSTTQLVGHAYLYNPQKTVRTGFSGSAAYPGGYLAFGSQTENYSADGFQIFAAGNAATYTGTVRVYGYRN